MHLCLITRSSWCVGAKITIYQQIYQINVISHTCWFHSQVPLKIYVMSAWPEFAIGAKENKFAEQTDGQETGSRGEMWLNCWFEHITRIRLDGWRDVKAGEGDGGMQRYMAVWENPAGIPSEQKRWGIFKMNPVGTYGRGRWTRWRRWGQGEERDWKLGAAWKKLCLASLRHSSEDVSSGKTAK